MKNTGKFQYRFKQNPLEEAFATAWEEINNRPNGMAGVLDYLLAENDNRLNDEVSERDRIVAATVVQWLGSPVGQSFLTQVLAWKELKWISQPK